MRTGNTSIQDPAGTQLPVFPPHANLRMFPGHFVPMAMVCVTLQGDDFRVDLPPLLSCEFLKDSYCFLFFSEHQTGSLV